MSPRLIPVAATSAARHVRQMLVALDVCGHFRGRRQSVIRMEDIVRPVPGSA